MDTLLIARNFAGDKFFWTGKAGEAWVSPKAADAFVAPSLEFADRKAASFNRFTILHGLKFEVVV